MINSTYKKANRLFYTILLVWVVQLGWAQIYPVQVNSNVLPPYLSSISKYSTTTDQKYLVNIFTSDLSVVNRQVKLKLYLQGNGINAQSAPVVVGASPLFINGGESLQLNNIDLAPYFELQNLQGINPLQYSGVLPQGNYNFCIEVYDFVTNQPISQKSCTFFYFIYNEPPLLNLPFNHEVIFFQDPQNIIFTWTPRHINATNIEYQFELIELLDNQAPSNYAFIVGAPVWRETLNNTILNYNFNLPQLVAGKKYAWRVKAVSQPGFGEEAIFNNNGYSEIYDFIYAGNCSAPEFVLAQSTSATQAKIMWQANPNHLANVVKFRKVGTEEWFNAPVANGQALLLGLEPSETYEFQVGGTCLGDITTFSAINQFTQPAKDIVAINCGIAPAIDLTNVVLYNEALAKDMVFMAADYAIHINEVEGVGTYTGKGWTKAPYLKNLKIAVEFENIKLNSELKLVDGEVKAQYDPTWGNILDINDVLDILDDYGDGLQESNDVHNHQVNFVIQDSTHIVAQNGQIIITTPQGTTGAIFDFDQGENTTITDQNGSVYNVDQNGNVTQLAQGIGIPDNSNTENLNSKDEVIALSNIGAKVVFKNNTRSTAFDDSSANYTTPPPKLAKHYKTIKDGSGNDYPFYYKGVINNEDGNITTDLVTAEITITDTLIKPKDIVFNLKGVKVEEESSSTVGNVTTKVLKVPAFTTVGENELLALVKIKTDSVKQKVIGAMKVIPIKNVGTVNVTLVPVNGATISQSDIQAVQEMYTGAGVTLNITIAPNHTDAITTLECGTSGWIANYTTEQNAFIERYKAGKTISDTQYYIFVTKGIQPSRPLSGFMPLHRQYGFVFSDETGTGEIKQTNSSGLATIIAHELGHGAFELEHPWEKFDYTVGAYTTNWLMDYASGSKLPYRHWQQISHPKTKLYLFQSDSSGELGDFSNLLFQDLIISQITDLTKLNQTSNCDLQNLKFLHPSGKILTQMPYEHMSNIDIRNGYLYSFDLNNHGVKKNGTYRISYNSEINSEGKIIKTSINDNEYICFKCLDDDKIIPKQRLNISNSKTEKTFSPNQTKDYSYKGNHFNNCSEGTSVVYKIESGSPVCVNLNKENCQELSSGTSTNVAYSSSKSYFLNNPKHAALNGEIDAEVVEQRFLQAISDLKSDLNSKIVSGACSYSYSDDENFKFITGELNLPLQVGDYLSFDGHINLSNKQFKLIEDRLKYLCEATDGETQIYVLFKKVNFIPNSSKWNEFTKEIFTQSNLNSKNAILITMPYVYNANSDAAFFWPGVYGKAKVDYSKIVSSYNGEISSLHNGSKDIFNFIKDIYTYTYKPQKIYAGFLHVDGSIIKDVQSKESVSGNNFIKEIFLFEEPEINLIKQLAVPSIEQNLGDITFINENYEKEKLIYDIKVADLVEQANQNNNWTEIDNSIVFKEKFIDSNAFKYIKNYAYKSGFSQWLTDVDNLYGDTDYDFNHTYNKDKWAIIDPIVLGTIDGASVVLSFVGADFIGDGIGVLYCTKRGDYVNGALYTTALVAPVLTGAELRLVKNAVQNSKFFFRGAMYSVKAGEKLLVKKVSGFYAKGKVLTFFDIADNAIPTNQLDNIITKLRNGDISNTQIKAVLNETDDAARVLKFKGLDFFIDDLLQIFKSKLTNRISNESNMILHYTDDELKRIIQNGKRLDIPEREIEDIIFNGCRNDKNFIVDDIVSQTNYWKEIKDRGYPNLFQGIEDFKEFSTVLKNLSSEWNLPVNSIYVQGSTLRVSDISKIGDIDIAIRVNQSTFDALVLRFRNATTSTGRQTTIINEATRGKITGGNMFFDTTTQGSFKGKIMSALEDKYGTSFSQKFSVSDLQISIIKEGSAIDVSPLLKLK